MVKTGRPLPEGAQEGTVITSVGPRWIVDAGGQLYVSTVSGTVDSPHTGTIVTVGDVVWIVPDPSGTIEGDPSASIVKVAERHTLLSRKAAGRVQREQVVVANVDQLCLVMAAALPDYNKRLIDRYLIAADKGELEPLLCINKIDLIPDEYRVDFHEDLAVYADLGLPVVFVSATTGEGMQQLSQRLAGRATLMSGPSGVGKSSLINLLCPVRQAVGAISEKYEKGRHTTTATIMLPLVGGGTIVDSPGIREFAIWDLSREELPFYFDEFQRFSGDCHFAPCTHTHEPQCAVKDAVERGEIDEERYVSYLNILDTIGRDDRA
jgi:ribosome biogenesis GTPase